MSVDLKTNEAKLLNAWKDVTDERTPTDWALFGYDGHSNTLKVVSSGDGGLAELAEDLNSNQIMYGFCRLPDPKTGLSKFVLINWQGEGAPMARKGACASHQRQVASLLHGHHLTVHARDEDEVDEAAVLEKLARAGSSSYNFHQRVAETSPQTKPVGTNYRRVVPAAEIDLSARDKFWEQQEQEEKQRRVEEQKRQEQERARLETERNRREMEEARDREHAALERSRSINEARQAERKAERLTSASDREAHRWQATLEQDRLEEQERAHRADRLRAERKQEAEQLIGHRTGAARAVFERNTSAGQMRSPTSPTSAGPPHAGRGVARRWPPENAGASVESKPHVNGSVSSAPVSNGHVTSAHVAPETAPPALPESAPPQRDSRESLAPEPPSEPAPAAVERSVHKSPERAALQPPSTRDLVDGAVSNSTSHVEPVLSAPEAFQEPVRSAPEPEPVREPEPARISEPATPPEPEIPPEPVRLSEPFQQTEPIREPEPIKQPEPVKDPEPLRQSDNEFYDAAGSESLAGLGNGGVVSSVSSTAPASGAVSEVQITTVTGELASVSLTEEHGLCAQALYDYQAADDTEITFDPGDIITNIDRIDEGWWQGVSPAGQFGLFPANYVQLIN